MKKQPCFKGLFMSAVALPALLAGSPIGAQENTQAEASVAPQGFYVYGAIGASTLTFDQDGIDSSLVAAGARNVSSSVDEVDFGYKLQVGYMFNRYVGIEGGWVDLGKFRYSATTATGSGSVSISAQGFNLAVLGAWPVADRFSLIGRLGMINADVKAKGTAVNASDTSVKPNLGLGAMYQVTPRVAIRAEWERFFNLGDENKTGQGDIDLWSVGLRYSF
jgi:OOP family OmpA-OmpF porin